MASIGSKTQSPLAMLVLVTPYTILYLVNQLFLNGILDNTHYVFFELIFVLAFRKLFGLPDLSERLFPAQVAIQSAEAVRPVKTAIANAPDSTAANGDAIVKKKVKKVVVRKAAPKRVQEQPYAKELAAMEKKFMDYVENTEIWEKVFEDDSRGLIEVYQYKARPMCYKIIAIMNNSAAATFDLLSDISRRIEWDPLCVEAKTIADISAGVKLQYVRTKGVWPTASRDTLLIGTVKKLGEGVFCNLTSSVEHHLMPERVSEKFVRMETAIAGQIVGPEPGQPNKCRLTQVLDADLKGWIPEKAVPDGIRKVNRILPSIAPYAESKIIERVAAELAAAKAAAENGEVEGGSEQDGSHELKSTRSSDLIAATSSVPDRHVNGNGKLHSNGGGAVSRKRPSTFRAFWEGVKQNLGYGATPGKTNRVLVMTIVFAVLGPSIARLRRRR
ncbi:hypothetical protein BGZ98_005457 [Dissophora globulifera]|nr:hypothetical protein BGZ98_005457 [Dissophora globulifera]